MYIPKFEKTIGELNCHVEAIVEIEGERHEH